MLNRRGVMALGLVTVFAASAALLAQNAPNQAPQKLTDAQKREITAIVAVVDGVAAGQPMPNDLSLSWLRDDLLKAQGNKQYVPFIVSLDASKVPGGTVSMYWRVVSKDAAPPPAPAQQGNNKNDRNDKKPPAPEYAYEDMATVKLPGGTSPARISRSFTVGPGSYDVFVVVKEPAPERQQRNAPPPKISLIKQTVEVPDLWNEELATSSVIVAERIDPLPAPLTPQQQAERPYVLGAMEIVPALSTNLTKKTELSTFLLIYNARTDAANKPDVTVEYNFYAKQGGAEKFFNKTNPQNLNAQTLPPQFDFAAGHQLQSGQAVPLASFPEGEYRLEIKITDKLANKTLTRDVNFNVSGA
jgi:hypothetical protein